MRLVLLLLALTVSGCATTGPAADEVLVPLETLDGVNGALASAPNLTVFLADGRVIHRARSAVVSAQDVRFVVDDEPVALPVEQVDRIVLPAARQAARGTVIGAAPGLTLLGLVVVGAASGETDSVAEAFAILLLGGVGVVMSLGGAVTGAAVGARLPVGPDREVYQAPVERYLTPSPDSTPVDR